MSNRCEGLPNRPCPDNRYDKTVKFTICDLFLCQSCEITRLESESKAATVVKDAGCKKSGNKLSSKEPSEVKAVGSSGGDVVASPALK